MGRYSRHNIRSAKLKPEEVLYIKQQYEAGRTQRDIAAEMKMSAVQIGRIVRGESWAAYNHSAKSEDIQHGQAALQSNSPLGPEFQFPPDVEARLKAEQAAGQLAKAAKLAELGEQFDAADLAPNPYLTSKPEDEPQDSPETEEPLK